LSVDTGRTALRPGSEFSCDTVNPCLRKFNLVSISLAGILRESLDVRIAVISPFVDRQHGTERVLAEQLTLLSTNHTCEIRLYSQTVQDLAVARDSPPSASPAFRIVWRPVPSVRGPHLLSFLFWLAANSVCRWWDFHVRRIRWDLLFSPGINSLNADAIAVHIVFHEYYRQAISQLGFRGAPLRSWPRRLHRRLYYLLIMKLEQRIYRNPRVSLTAVSLLVAKQLQEYFGRCDVTVIPNGVATNEFNSELRLARREIARKECGLRSRDFVLLLLGNDWVKKGLPCLLRSLQILKDLPIRLIVAGQDDTALFASDLQQLNLNDRVSFCRPRSDVLFYYAAADAYVGPSIEDAFGLPVIEAMACGLPVIASARAGASQAIQHGLNGFLLQDPTSPQELAQWVGNLFSEPALRERLGKSAEITARGYSWENNAAQLMDFLTDVAAREKTPQ
jgi:glycosyltransferase involved in cell wall biosynthesis